MAVLAAGLPGLGLEDEVGEQQIVDQGDVERGAVLRLVLAAAFQVEVAAPVSFAVPPRSLVAEREVVEGRGFGEVLGVDEFVAVGDAGLGVEGGGDAEEEHGRTEPDRRFAPDAGGDAGAPSTEPERRFAPDAGQNPCGAAPRHTRTSPCAGHRAHGWQAGAPSGAVLLGVAKTAHQTTSGTTKGSRYSRVSIRFASSSPSIVSVSGSIVSHEPTIGCSISGSMPLLTR